MLEITKDYLTARAITRMHNARNEYAEAKVSGKLAARIYANPDRSTWAELTLAKELMDDNPWIYLPDTAIREFEQGAAEHV